MYISVFGDSNPLGAFWGVWRPLAPTWEHLDKSVDLYGYIYYYYKDKIQSTSTEYSVAYPINISTTYRVSIALDLQASRHLILFLTIQLGPTYLEKSQTLVLFPLSNPWACFFLIWGATQLWGLRWEYKLDLPSTPDEVLMRSA